MGLALYTVLLAGVAGHLRGGRIYRLGKIQLRRTGWLFGAAGCQLALALGVAATGGHRTLAIVATALAVALGYGLLGPFIAANLWVPGVALAGLGVAANALVITANGAMPVSATALASAGASVSPAAARAGAGVPWPDDPRHAWSGPDTRLSWLGDVIPVRLPLRQEAASAGDVLLAAGLGLFVYAGLRTGAQRTTNAARSTMPANDSTTRGSNS